MKAIGGYLELELPISKHIVPHSDNCVALNSGRHALEYILMQLPENAKKIYIPYYTCIVLLQPLRNLGIEYEFYHINQDLEITTIPELRDNEYIIVNNYFGIKDAYLKSLYPKLGKHLIEDNSQAFYAEVNPGIKSFYSPRKFFGIPDGGYAHTEIIRDLDIETDVSTNRSSHLLKRIDEGSQAGYHEFRNNANKLEKESLKKMSNLTRTILQSIDFEGIKAIRRRNFDMLHNSLAQYNLIDIPSQNSFACPLVYPFRTKDKDLRKKLIENLIYVATYWPNVKDWCNPGDEEYLLCEEIIPLPIDQRYDINDMNRIISKIK